LAVITAWKLTPGDATIRTVQVTAEPEFATEAMVTKHLKSVTTGGLCMYPLRMQDGSHFAILYDRRMSAGIENTAAKRLFKRFRVNWYGKEHPMGDCLILYVSPDGDVTPFPAFASTLDWVRYVNSNMDYGAQYLFSPHGYGILLKKLPTVSEFLQKRVGSTSKDMSVLAPLILPTLRDDEECPIALEPLHTFGTIYVPECGHVCGPDAVALKTCPVCRCTCTWTAVCNLPKLEALPSHLIKLISV
jgi:hypothetical protein